MRGMKTSSSVYPLLIAATVWGGPPSGSSAEAADGGGALRATEFLPDGHATDGSVAYQEELQRAIDAAAERRRPLVFPAMTYRLDDPKGLRLRSHSDLRLGGAVLRLAADCDADGQAFLGRGVADVHIAGGTVVGRREEWPDSVNIAGVRLTGAVRDVTVDGTTFRDLSANAVGVFAEGPEKMARDVVVRDVVARNCCNIYRDYRSENPGPAEGSERKDQGSVAFYHVRDFAVHGCRLVGSRSDGTHFYKCREGRFTNNRVASSAMGGYFVEGGKRVLASDNTIVGNGSRGVTVERGARDCTLVNNVVARSGREGLWAPDAAGGIVRANVFRHNGRKDDDPRDAEIRIQEREKWPKGSAYRIEGNLIETTEDQSAAIRVTAGVEGVVIRGNTLRGAVRRIRPGPWITGEGTLSIRDNHGWRTEASGTATFKADGNKRVFRIPHGLVSPTPRRPIRKHTEVVAQLTPGSESAAAPHSVHPGGKRIEVRYQTPPSAGPVEVHWTARLRPRQRGGRPTSGSDR